MKDKTCHDRICIFRENRAKTQIQEEFFAKERNFPVATQHSALYCEHKAHAVLCSTCRSNPYVGLLSICAFIERSIEKRRKKKPDIASFGIEIQLFVRAFVCIRRRYRCHDKY